MSADNDTPDDTAFGLIVSFPDQSASFVHGFEMGQLWQRMEHGAEAEITATVHDENREVIVRSADALGWSAEIRTSSVFGWAEATLVKRRPSRLRPNPHGLRIVGGTP